MYDPNSSHRAFLRHSTTLTALLALGGHRMATAQPIAGSLPILCSGPAGSIPDIIARRYAEQLAGRFADGAVVDNRVGAAGQIAVGALQQASPDGTTILLAQGAVATVYPYLYAKLAYDQAVDLKPMSMAVEPTLGLAVGPGVPDSVVHLRDLVDWTWRNPALANYGSPGIGTLPHLLGAVFFREAQVESRHVAYQGGPPAIVDLLGGRLLHARRHSGERVGDHVPVHSSVDNAWAPDRHVRRGLHGRGRQYARSAGEPHIRGTALLAEGHAHNGHSGRMMDTHPTSTQPHPWDAGDQTLDIAHRVGATGEVLATDISGAILALAHDKLRAAGFSQVRTQVADVLHVSASGVAGNPSGASAAGTF